MSGMIVRRTALGIALALILGTAAHARPAVRVDSQATEPAGITATVSRLWSELLQWMTPTGRRGLTSAGQKAGSQMDPDGAALRVPLIFPGTPLS